MNALAPIGVKLDMPSHREPAQHHESADEYSGIIARLDARHRVITCKDGVQWILQRKRGERCGRARWTGVGYCLTREALLRLCRAFGARIDPSELVVLAALPRNIAGCAR